MQKINDPKEIAERMANSFESDLHAFVFDQTIVDPNIVGRLVALSGADHYLQKYHKNNIIIYTIKFRLIESRCRQVECREVEPERRRICVAKCLYTSMEQIARTVASSIREAARMIEVSDE